MFTGIVEEAGQVINVREGADAIRLALRATVCGIDARVGDSIAVNGCCLTVVQIEDHSGPKVLHFDLLRETWARTNLKTARSGSLVNLERSLAANGRLHGHFVTGHIDGTAEIDIFEQRGPDWYLRVRAPRDLLRYIVFKGSVAMDGISLTVAEVTENSFSVWIIPHTRAVTALRERTAGDLVNLEADLLAKYVEKIFAK
jgi:riboflavin synthase